jgi:chromosome segregation protein
MRLTQIKLAGFKSFVDPTSINVPGQLVGVVGPNGCGKSNIIDAVRWVLGETRASALRGDSMQDVIFNGSAQRNPVARASVELHFDNSHGKATGPWSPYSEIAVKRVLQRDGESSYFINNTHVRRRDVQDIFLGTGLGPRAYAIVEQGMISRIIEAKPEELRVFLEEAAGISKYKERRRETENRLADTRENLARVNDIRQELDAQIEKLEKQAEIAARYQRLVAERDQKQNLLYLIRRNDSRAEQEKHSRELAALEIQIERDTAELRDLERRLEEIRIAHLDAANNLNAAQAALFEVNSEVAAMESEIRHISETRLRIGSQLEQERTILATARQQSNELEEARAMWQQRLTAAEERLAQAISAREAEQTQLPVAEGEYARAQEALGLLRLEIGEAESALELEISHAGHAQRNLATLNLREQRLKEEAEALQIPESAELERLRGELDRSAEEIARQENLLAQMEDKQGVLESVRDTAIDSVAGCQRDLAAVDAKLVTLQRVQSRFDEDAKAADWLAQHQLDARPRLWQELRVEPGWENAIESVLRERLHSMQVEDGDELTRLAHTPPAARFQLHAIPGEGQGGVSESEKEPPPNALLNKVSLLHSGLGEMLSTWLSGFCTVEGVPTLAERLALRAGEVLVNKAGHQYSRYGIVFHSPDSEDSGILARQREIDSLAEEASAIKELIDTALNDQANAVQRLEEHVHALSTLRAAGEVLKQRHHELQLQQVRRSEENERYLRRKRQIEDEISEIAKDSEVENRALESARSKSEEMRAKREQLAEAISNQNLVCKDTGDELVRRREVLKRAEMEEQTAGFGKKECVGKIEEIDAFQKQAQARVGGSESKIESLTAEVAGLNSDAIEKKLHLSLDERVKREEALTQARIRQDELAEHLRSSEESRQTLERRVVPQRDRIAELKLKEQAARLSAEQFAAQLAANGADERELEELSKDGYKPSALQGEITKLGNAILELGAINMAALEELTASSERKLFLDSQSQDLTEALDILESAIRRIDRETRELLQSTFDTVNSHFGELFPALFGGGEARLEMSGEEILDAGVQVIARPPGKKNSSIHLLSGGEKALTAISLVFAIFQLNPAPFCLLDEVDAPLDDSNTVRFCDLVKKMSDQTQFLFISHNKITMEMSNQLVGVTMQEQGVSRVVSVDMEEALRMREPMAA